jgi:lipopolysaccharide export system permease protein
LHNNLGISSYFHFSKIKDSTWKQVAARTIKPFRKLIPDSLKQSMEDRTRGTLSGLRNQVDIQQLEYAGQEANIRSHEVEWHRKFSLSVACMVLFLIGAPLGSIIRKGGLGLPLVFAVVFFVIFHLLNTFGEKFAKGQVMSPFFGMWLSVLCMIPIGLFLTYKAMQDSQLFNKEFYNRTFKQISLWINRMQEKRRNRQKLAT